MSEAIHTSFKRYERVHEILKGDNALKRKLSTRMAAVCKPDRSFVDFPVEVVHVTDEIHKQGLDVATMTKLDVVRHGFRLLVQNPGPIPMPAAPTPAAPKPAATPKPKKPAPVKAKAQKPKPKPPEKKPKAKPKAAPKGPATAASRPAAVDPTPAGETKNSSPAVPKMPPSHVRPYVPYVVGVAALSNLQAVLTLFEPFVATGDTDAKEVCAKANELIDDIHRRTVLPSAEKEPTTSAG